jgi:peptidyl-prolyl cis-trans isomerase D
MLKVMRSHKFFTVFILGATVILISAAFIFTGVVGPQAQRSKIAVANVGDEIITQTEFKREYYNLEQLVKENPNLADIKNLDLQKEVINKLIDEKVLLAAAKKAGIKVTKDELQKEIMDTPYFQRDGIFDNMVYGKTVKMLHYGSTREFEDGLADNMMRMKMAMVIGETAELTDSEMQIIDLIKGDKAGLIQNFLKPKKDAMVKAYIDALKRGMTISVKEDIIPG